MKYLIDTNILFLFHVVSSEILLNYRQSLKYLSNIPGIFLIHHMAFRMHPPECYTHRLLVGDPDDICIKRYFGWNSFLF
jgi:hypothetical protein